MTLTEFLLARIAEDEAVAAAVECSPENREHIARFDPARALSECKAKRQIIAEWTAEDEFDRSPENWRRGIYGRDLLYLAAVYADHPDYNPEWRP